jgi:polysaccharide pyruvyl transferase WcaK-like protein
MHGRNIALPWGIFGSGNIGDEAMLQGFAELVGFGTQDPIRVWVASRNPAHVSRVVPAFRYFRTKGTVGSARRRPMRRAEAYLIVGDTPVMDYLGPWPLTDLAKIAQTAKARRKRIACLGVGTEHLSSEPSIRRLADQIAPIVEHWTVRTEKDKARLARYGVDDRRVTVAADLGWLVPPVDDSFGMRWLERLEHRDDRPLIGVNLTHDRWSLDQSPGLPSLIASVLDRVIDGSGVHVMLFANEVREGEGFDSAGIREVLSRASRADHMFAIPNRYWHPQEAMSFVACCDITLTMRYHFAIFSALQDVPFVSLSRLGKLKDLCADLGWSHQVPLEDASAAEIESLIDRAMENRDRLSLTLRQAKQAMAGRARLNVRSLEQVLGKPFE